MQSRWFNIAVVLLWFATMSWLIVEKVMPPLLVGDPPNYRTILAAKESEPAAGWEMRFNGRPLGWALNLVSRRPDDVTEIHSRVHFDENPINSLLKGLPSFMLPLANLPTFDLPMDADSAAVIDPLGRLMRFESALRIEGIEKPIRVLGTIDGGQLKMEVRAFGDSNLMETSLPANSLVTDAFSPQSQLPGLRAGQTWTVPVYSPLRPWDNPVEILHATVEDSQPFTWGGRTELVWLVVYRNDPGAGLGSGDSPRGKLWVRTDGTVLQQEAMVFNSTLTFERLTENRAAELATEVGLFYETVDGGKWKITEHDYTR